MNNLYITVGELQEYGFGRDRAVELIKLVKYELEQKGFFLPNGLKAPRKAVLARMGVDE